MVLAGNGKCSTANTGERERILLEFPANKDLPQSSQSQFNYLIHNLASKILG